MLLNYTNFFTQNLNDVFQQLKFDEGCWNSQMILVNLKKVSLLPLVAKKNGKKSQQTFCHWCTVQLVTWLKRTVGERVNCLWPAEMLNEQNKTNALIPVHTYLSVFWATGFNQYIWATGSSNHSEECNGCSEYESANSYSSFMLQY